MHTPAELRASLAAQLKLSASAYVDAKRAMEVLSKFVNFSDRLPWESTLIEEVIATWLRRVLAEVSTAHQGDSSAVITNDDLPAYFREFRTFARRTFRSLHDNDMPLHDAVEDVLARYDFDNLVRWLAKRATNLEAAGFVAVANHLADGLSLNANHWRAKTPALRTGRFVFERHLYSCSFSGYSYSECEGLFRLAEAMGVMQRVMGVAGAHTSMHAIATELRNARKPLPSRTVIGRDSAISATVFKEKLSLSMAPVVADALLAFVSMYATVQLVGNDGRKAA